MSSINFQEMGTLGTRSTALAEGEGSGSASEPARFEAAEDKTVRAAIDDSGGTRVGSGGSGGELVRSFVELVKTVEAKVSVGMNFGDLDTCMSRLRGSESVGELESGLGDERKVVSIGSKTNSDANLGDEENGNSLDETKTNSAVNKGDEENGNSFVDTKTNSGVNQGDEENVNSFHDTKFNSGVNNGVEENGKSLDEIGQELGGETELIEVPIAGTSENGEDWVGEELGDQVHEFSVGDFVWGKIKNHPWWPGQICDPSDASEFAAKLKSKDKLLVAYFGDGTFAWCHPSQLKPFEENFVENSKLSSSKVFVIAVQQAVDEIGRLVKLKMSCTCMGEEFLSGLNQPLASNAGIKEGAVVPEGKVGKLLGHLSQPADLLTELKHIAQVVSLTSVLELNVLKSLLSAFYCSKGGYQLPVYLEPHLIPGLEDDRKVVEVPVQWPFEDWLSSPLGSNTGNADQSLLQRSPPSIENRQPHRRKVKSIADLLGGADGVQAKTVDGVIAKEGEISEKRGLSSRRKKQESRDNHGVGILTSESGKERAKLSKSPISTHIKKILSVDNECSGRKEETKKGPLSRRRKRDEYIGINSNDGETQEKTGGKEETKKAPSSRRRKKDEGIQINSNDGEAKGKTGDNPISRVGELPNVGLQNDMKDQIDKSPSSRERKKSKYLSPPFTRSDMGKRRRNLETESPNAVTSHHDMGKEGKERDMEFVSLEVSNKAQFGERMTRAAANLKESPQILNCCSEALQEKPSTEGENNSIDPKTMHATSRGSGPKTPAEGEKKRIDPMKANVAANEVLSGVRSAAVDAFHPVKRKSSFEIVVDFTSIFRDSVYRNGSNYKRYKNHQSHGKRKKSDSEPGSLGKDNQTAAKLSEGDSGKRNIKKNQEMKYDKQTKKQAAETPRSKRKKLDSVIKSLGKDNQNSESGKRNINKNQDKPTKKTAAEPPISKLVRRRSKHAETQDLKMKETGEETSHTSLFVTFGPGSSLPTKDVLLKIYSKFGELNETETEMFYTNFCARIAFVRSSDAEEAFNHSLIDSPFGPSNVNFRLQNPAGAAKTRELSAIPKSPPAKKSMGKKTAGDALVASQPPAGEPSQLDFIRHKLEMMSSMLGSSDRKVLPVTKSKLQNEIKELLKAVSTTVDTSS